MSERIYIERYWRKATKEDSVKDPMMDARFRAAVKSDQEYCEDPAKDLVMDAMFRATAAGCDWVYGKLYGWDRETNLWSSEENCGWDEAEVYDAPDPGEGYELIDIKKTTKQEGDEVLGDDGKWSLADRYNFVPDLHYRRRITPTVTYVPFTWEDREQLRGRWVKFKNGREVQCTKLEPLNHGGGMVINCYTPLELLQNATFLDTGKPVGKEVMQ